MTAASTDVLVSAYERRITWNALASGAYTDRLTDGDGWDFAYILADKGPVEIYFDHTEVAPGTYIQLQPGVGGVNALHHREAIAGEAGMINPWCPDMLLKNTNVGAAKITLVLSRRAIVTPRQASDLTPHS